MVNRYNIGEDDAVTVQGGLGKPPDFPGSGAAALRNREYFRTPQTGPGGSLTSRTHSSRPAVAPLLPLQQARF